MRARMAFGLALALALVAAGGARAAALESAWGTAPDAPAAFAAAPVAPGCEARLASWPIAPPSLSARVSGNGTPRSGPGPLNAERARVMLQSLTVPGWGQMTTGHHGAATVFYLLDAAIWTSFISFEIQSSMRMESSIRTAQLYAGIDLDGRSDDYRRIVGAYPSSDEYNRLVVYRDAANLYYNDPAQYRAYIAQHEITGSNAWSWVSPESYARYTDQRQSSQKAGLRANSALALALANRIVSAIHAAGASGHMTTGGRSLRLEWTPDFSQDPPGMRIGLRTSY